MSRLRALALFEMWRQALLIQLYQDVHQLGPMASKMKTALSQILHLNEMVTLTDKQKANSFPRVDLWDMSMVWFLAGTVALTEEQRTTCLSNLENIGSEQAITDNVTALKAYWKEVDDTGKAVDWKMFLEQKKLAISYTF